MRLAVIVVVVAIVALGIFLLVIFPRIDTFSPPGLMQFGS